MTLASSVSVGLHFLGLYDNSNAPRTSENVALPSGGRFAGGSPRAAVAGVPGHAAKIFADALVVDATLLIATRSAVPVNPSGKSSLSASRSPSPSIANFE